MLIKTFGEGESFFCGGNEHVMLLPREASNASEVVLEKVPAGGRTPPNAHATFLQIKEIDIHILASIRNGLYLEYFPWLDPLLLKPLEVRGGMAAVPQCPGLGIEFKPEAIKEYRVA